jgi:hypothetical protein
LNTFNLWISYPCSASIICSDRHCHHEVFIRSCCCLCPSVGRRLCTSASLETIDAVEYDR